MEIINGDQAKRNEALNKKNEAQENFNKSYNGNRNMKDTDFTNKSDWKAYKSARNNLENAENIFTKAENTFQKTQAKIDNYKNVDPEGYNKIDNLTYTNKNGEVKAVDVLVNLGNTSGYGGGMTVPKGLTTLGNITDNKILTTIDSSLSFDSDALAHEFGHVLSIAADPLKYLSEARDNPYPCNPSAQGGGTKKGNFLTEQAEAWQSRYNKLKNKK